MIKTTVFPSLRWRSFTFLLFVIDTCLYILSLLYFEYFYHSNPSSQYSYDTENSGFNANINCGFLAPSRFALFNLGELDADQIKNQQEYWRLISAMFLHANFLHFICSSFLKCYLISFVESQEGAFRTMYSILLINAFGSTFQVLLSDAPGVAGSFSIAVIILSQTHENSIFQSKKNSNLYAFFSSSHESNIIPIIKALLLLVIVYFANGVYPIIPFYGHLGAYVMSFMLSKSIPTSNTSKESKWIYRLWLLFSHLALAAIVALFILFRTPNTLGPSNR